MKTCLVLALILALAAGFFSQDSLVVPQRVSRASVLVKCQNSYGSGVCFRNKEHSFIWTAAHVLTAHKEFKKVYLPSGDLQIQCEMPVVWVSQDVVTNHKKVGRHEYLARVIRLSDKHDLALLVVSTTWPRQGVTFSQSVPTAGTRLWHVGSMCGPGGAGSLSEMIFSSSGRLRKKALPNDDGLIYDQLSGVAQAGSSGGGVFRQDSGECVGILTEFLYFQSAGSLCIVPARRVREFAKSARCEWAVDSSIKVPLVDKEPLYQDVLEVD